METKTRQWKKVAAAFCMVLMVAAIVVFPTQAKAAYGGIGPFAMDQNSLEFTVAPGASITVSVRINYRNISNHNDMWLQYDGSAGRIAEQTVTEGIPGFLNPNMEVTFDIVAPTTPGTYSLKAYAYDLWGTTVSTTNSTKIVVTAPNAGAGKTTDQGTAHWMGVHYEMFYTTAKTVHTNADMQSFDYVPHYIFDFLTANPSLTLRVQYKGDVYVLNEKNMQAHNVLPGLNYLFSSLDAMGL